METDNTKIWPALYTCPAGDDDNLRRDDLGEGMFNPVFSNRGKMVNNGCEGCGDCDMQDSCNGPVTYVPLRGIVPDGRRVSSDEAVFKRASELHEAVWSNGEVEIPGRWVYDRGADRFHIWLDSIDQVTRRARYLVVAGDKPEWGDWKRVEKKT
jgi:hypothetical protein